ncbi:UNVERIFIED_CONTAM: hypothetical protein FKN15_026592 [Acipenser sinensis]
MPSSVRAAVGRSAVSECFLQGEDEEGYIEDCYVPQRSIYDTMRINEQIDQGSKLNQPSRSTLGSGGGEGSTLSSNGTLGAGVGGAASLFESRQPEAGRKLDERVIFDALKLTGDSPAKPAPSLAPGSGSAASSGLVLGSGAVPGGVPKRRAGGGGGGGGGKDNVNRRSWKAFMPPNYPEFAERMEISVGDYPGEKRLSGLMSPVLPHPLTPASLPLTPAPHSTPSSPGDFYSVTPNYTPPQLPQQLHHAQRPPSQHQQHQHQKQQPILTAQSPLLPPVPVFQKEQVEPLQPRLHQANRAGQGLIQSAGKNSDTQGLEHELQETNARWNTLNKRVAERITHLQEALLHCGKFQDALEPLLSWLTDTEELTANQRPPSTEYKVVKAQIQEQKLLQRLLDDRRGTVEMIKAEGERIAQQSQLEELLVLAKQFHETTEPLGEWLSATEKKLANSEPVGTQTSKINQQITQHKALSGEISGRSSLVDRAVSLGASLSPLSCPSDRARLSELLQGVQEGYREVRERACRKGALLEQALANARIFGEDEVEVLNWLAEVQDRLEGAAVRDFRQAVLHRDHSIQLALSGEISGRSSLVDRAVSLGASLSPLSCPSDRARLSELLQGVQEGYREVRERACRKGALLEQALANARIFGEDEVEVLNWLAEVQDRLEGAAVRDFRQAVLHRDHSIQLAFSIDIIRHKDSIDELLATREEILGTCGEEQKAGLQRKTDSLLRQYDAVSQLNLDRYARLERAQVLVNQFWETHEELLPWLQETQTLLGQLPGPAVNHEALRQQQEEMRQLRESISEHKPHIDKLLKIGPQLEELNPGEGEMVRERYGEAGRCYAEIKEEVKRRATALDEAVSQSTQLLAAA